MIKKVETNMIETIYTNVARGMNPINTTTTNNNNNDPLNKYGALIEKLAELESKDWPKFQNS